MAPNAQAHLLPEAAAERRLLAVRCSAVFGAARVWKNGPMGSLAQEACAYGQSRGVIPFFWAYLAADASTSDRTNA
jgi:hypothetical protein